MFSDEELDHWKSIGAPEGWEKLPALIARLEAAELIAQCIMNVHPRDENCGCSMCDLIEVWLRTAGKEK